MGSIEQNWRTANDGRIQPLLTEEEIAALAKHGVNTMDDVRFENPETGETYERFAVDALRECSHIRLPRRPESGPRELARHKV